MGVRKSARAESITVAILTYNSADSIERCIGSVISQRVLPKEILVIDDDSTDETLQIVRSLRLKSVKIIRNGARNISVGRNIALRAARGDIVAYLDSDAYAHRDWLYHIFKLFNSDSHIAVVGGKEIPIYKSFFAEGVATNDLAVKAVTGEKFTIKGCNFCVHKKRLGAVQFSGAFVHNEETEFLERVHAMGYSWRYCTNGTVQHECRSSMKSYSRQMFRYGFWRVMLNKQYGNWRIVDYVPLSCFCISLFLSLFWIWFLFLPGLMVLAQVLLTVIYSKRNVFSLLPYIFSAWVVKDVCWAAGTAKGLLSGSVKAE